MSGSKENPEKSATDSSRRKLLSTAELLAGAVASVVTTETALARPTDVFLDSSGRVHIKGTTAQGTTERIQTARRMNFLDQCSCKVCTAIKRGFLDDCDCCSIVIIRGSTAAPTAKQPTGTDPGRTLKKQ